MSLWDWLFHRREREEELDEEVQAHLRMAAQERIEQGETAEQARASAVREFGNVTLVKETTRDMWGFRWLETLLQDLRYGARGLRRNPGFTAVAVIALTLGIGANTAIFSVVESVLWKPLPLPDPDRLVHVSQRNLKRPWESNSVSIPNFMDWRLQNEVFEQLAAWGQLERYNLSGGETSMQVLVSPVSANFFLALGIRFAVGRGFLRGEEQVGHNHVAILSDRLWREQFGSDPRVLGSIIRLAGDPYVVVGVIRENKFLEDSDLFVPTALSTPEASERDKQVLFAYGRLKEGVSVGQARANMDAIARRLAIKYPEANANWGVRVDPLRQWMTEGDRPFLMFFLGASALVLLIACVDVANLSLLRATARETEFAVRAALGAGRRMLIRQLLTESTMLALSGGVLSVLVAIGGVGLCKRMLPPYYISRIEEIGIDNRVLGFTLIVSLITAIVFGLAPALFASGVDLNAALRHSGRTQIGRFRHRRFQSALVVAEVALAMILLFGAGLFISSLFRLEKVNAGFNPRNLLTTVISLEGEKYSAPHNIGLFYQQLLEKVRAIPGVEAAVAASNLPLTSGRTLNFSVEGRPRPAPGEEPWALWRVVTPGFFQAMKIPLLRGRYFTEQDTEGSPRVAIINENLARQHFPGEDPIGEELTIRALTHGGSIPPGKVQIVGVVANVKEVGLNEIPFRDVYLPFLQSPVRTMYLAVRTSQAGPGVPATLRRIASTIDKDQPVGDIKTMQERVSESLAENRFNMFLTAAFAALALILALVGIYGVISYSVAQRTHEIGIRMALGAQAANVMRLVEGQTATLALTGVVLGLVASLILGRLLGSMLYMVPYQHIGLIYGVSTDDPTILSSISVLLVAVSLLACYIPARRAAKIDPMVALRYE
jgi:putative ABC transport system permease protein